MLGDVGGISASGRYSLENIVASGARESIHKAGETIEKNKQIQKIIDILALGLLQTKYNRERV